MKVGSILHMPPVFVGGRSVWQPLLSAQLQVNGTFRGDKKGKIAVLLRSADGGKVKSCVKEMHMVTGSKEADWAAVYYGILYGLDNNERSLMVDSDSLAVVYSLYDRTAVPHQEYARIYREKIYNVAAETGWTGIRWVPRAYNKADKLFRDLA
jgi:ribonuclease HI